MMRFSHRLQALALAGASALVILTSGCQGSYSTGSQMPPTGQGGNQQPVYPQSPPSRQQYVDTTVALPSAAPSMTLADLAGFSVRIDLVKASPSPVPTAAPSARALKKGAAVAQASPSPKASAKSSPSPAPTATATATGSPKPKPTPSGPRIETKLTIFPDGAQKPPGDTENIEGRRVALVVALMHPTVDVALYSLDAVHFIVPDSERTDKRQFTIAIYETRKHHKDREMASQIDLEATSDGSIATNDVKGAITLEKGHAYTAILFADPPPQTPAPVQAAPAYAPATPTPVGYPQQSYPGQTPFGQQPQPYPGQPGQPYPGQPGYPQTTPTPYRPF